MERQSNQTMGSFHSEPSPAGCPSQDQQGSKMRTRFIAKTQGENSGIRWGSAHGSVDRALPASGQAGEHRHRHVVEPQAGQRKEQASPQTRPTPRLALSR